MTENEGQIENTDFYWEGPYMVFTSRYLKNRGKCCGSGCRHCPYDPKWTAGAVTTSILDQLDDENPDKANRQ